MSYLLPTTSRAILTSVRNISTVVFDSNAYTRRPEVRAYIEVRIKDYCATKKIDGRGAETAVLIGTFHFKGKDPNAPFHGTFKFLDQNGNPLITRDKNGRPTARHHVHWHADDVDMNNSALEYKSGEGTKDW